MSNIAEKIRRASRVKRWFENDEVQQVWQELGDALTVAWTQTKSDQDEEREMLYRQVSGLAALRKRILKIIDDGKKAELEVNNGK